MNLKLIREKFSSFHTVLEPDENIPEWWAGAPSVVRDDEGIFWLAVRMREGNSPRGSRGYEIRILSSEDGIHFEKVHSIHRDSIPIRVFERPSLVIEPKTGKFKLYACGPWPVNDEQKQWSILKFDDVDNPKQFNPKSCRAVLQPPLEIEGSRENDIRGYKDAFVFIENKEYHMFTIGYARTERTYHFISEDGEIWYSAEPNLAFDMNGWHNFFTRPACILPLGIGYLLVYEGSHSSWFDPVYNIATGLAFSFDLNHFVDLTPDEPLLRSTTPGDYITWRYSHWMWIENKIMVYAEVARPNNTNEVRLFTIDR